MDYTWWAVHVNSPVFYFVKDYWALLCWLGATASVASITWFVKISPGEVLGMLVVSGVLGALAPWAFVLLTFLFPFIVILALLVSPALILWYVIGRLRRHRHE